MLEYEQYVKIKNHYCLCYFGHAAEYLVQLKLVRPFLERKFPGLKLFICCRDEQLGYLDPQDFGSRDLKQRRTEFAFMRELLFNGRNPVDALLEECRIDDCAVHHQPITEGKCAILATEISDRTTRVLSKKHGLVFCHDNWRACETVIGRESAEFYQAAAEKPSILLGPGSRLYKKLFPAGEICEVGA